jgi:hypothetical protein
MQVASMLTQKRPSHLPNPKLTPGDWREVIRSASSEVKSIISQMSESADSARGSLNGWAFSLRVWKFACAQSDAH